MAFNLGLDILFSLGYLWSMNENRALTLPCYSGTVQDR